MMVLTDLNKNSRVLDQLIVPPPTRTHRLSRFGKHGSVTNEKHDRDHSATGRKDKYPCTLCDTYFMWTATDFLGGDARLGAHWQL